MKSGGTYRPKIAAAVPRFQNWTASAEGARARRITRCIIIGSEVALRCCLVEEKFPQEKFRVLSEMRFLGKIRVAILDLAGYVEILAKFGAKSDFRV